MLVAGARWRLCCKDAGSPRTSKYVGDRGRRSAASSVIPAAQSLFRQALLVKRGRAVVALAVEHRPDGYGGLVTDCP